MALKGAADFKHSHQYLTLKHLKMPGVNYLDVWASTILTGAVGV